MRTLVTGGQGFIGSFLVKKLQERGDNVEVIDIKSGRDIRTEDFKHSFDVVYHLAALRSVPNSFAEAREYFDTNVYGSYRVLEAYRDTRIVNISTSSASNPIAPYGLSKKLAEKIAAQYENTISLRLFNPFGEGGKCNDLVVPIFANAMVDDEQVYIHSDGNQDRDFTYVHDIVDEIIHYGQNEETGITELGYGNSTSVNEVFRVMSEFFNYKKQPKYLPKRIGDQVHTQAWDRFNVKTVGFSEGLKRTMQWYKAGGR